MKCNGHIKIMANLISTLIESEDSLELKDKELKVVLNNEPKQIEQTQPSHSTNPSAEQKLIDRLLASFQNENNQLWSCLQRGEKNTEFLKTCFDKLLDNVSHKDKGSVNNDTPRHQDNINNINTYPFLADPMRKTNVSVHLPNNQPHKPFRQSHIPEKGQHNSQYDHNKFYSVYEIKNPRTSEPNVGFNDEETIRSLNEEIGRMAKELKSMKKEKAKSENSMQEIVKKLVEIKSENEALLQQKDQKMEGLMACLQEANNKTFTLQTEVSFLRENNKSLEQTINDVLRTHSKVLELESLYGQSFKQEDRYLIEDLRDANAELKKRINKLEIELSERDRNNNNSDFDKLLINNLQTKVRDLEQTNIDLEAKNTKLYNLVENKMSTPTTPTTLKAPAMNNDDFDFLKCIYAQGSCLEDYIGYSTRMSLFNTNE